jgi:large subunit ribosomal protein L7A
MTIDTLKAAKKAIGAKQTVKSVERGQVEVVFLASDAENRVVQPIRELCSKKNIAVQETLTMQELGQACGIAVGAAAVAVLK